MKKRRVTITNTLGRGFYKGVTREIRRSRKPVTILFTDVVESTRYWDIHGDVKGRLMIDLHNRLIYPVIRRYRGKVIKHIGDAIMASFKSPGNALRAAIGIQQILEQRRKRDKNFRLKVRIGVHTGKAIVEDKDVFGDTVNLAARVESCANGDEICVSGDTIEGLDERGFGLVKTTSIVPKGKQDELIIYTCGWQKHPSVIDNIKEDAFFHVLMRQKFELLAYFFACLGILYFMYFYYIRYVMCDREDLALLTLNLQRVLDARIAVPSALVILAVAAVVFLFRIGTVPYFALRILKGGFGFAIGFMIFFLPSGHLKSDFGLRMHEAIHESHHLFVRVLEDNIVVHEEPSDAAPALFRVHAGTILLLADVVEREGMKWNKVLVAKGKYGWIPRVVPAKIGVPETRLSIANKFYFKYSDLYALILGVLGFVWGVFSFRIRPA